MLYTVKCIISAVSDFSGLMKLTYWWRLIGILDIPWLQITRRSLFFILKLTFLTLNSLFLSVLIFSSQKLTFLSSGAGSDAEIIKTEDFDTAASILKQGQGVHFCQNCMFEQGELCSTALMLLS